jgi:hypothetical protein
MEWSGISEIDMTLERQPDGNILPAMPLNLFTEELDEYCQDQMDIVDSFGINWLDRSICQRYNVNNVPLKPIVDEDEEPELHAWLANSNDGLRYVHPKQMLTTNIGSNRGVCRILRDYAAEVEATRPSQYRIILSDIDVFMKCLRVIYTHALQLVTINQ